MGEDIEPAVLGSPLPIPSSVGRSKIKDDQVAVVVDEGGLRLKRIDLGSLRPSDLIRRSILLSTIEETIEPGQRIILPIARGMFLNWVAAVAEPESASRELSARQLADTLMVRIPRSILCFMNKADSFLSLSPMTQNAWHPWWPLVRLSTLRSRHA